MKIFLWFYSKSQSSLRNFCSWYFIFRLLHHVYVFLVVRWLHWPRNEFWQSLKSVFLSNMRRIQTESANLPRKKDTHLCTALIHRPCSHGNKRKCNFRGCFRSLRSFCKAPPQQNIRRCLRKKEHVPIFLDHSFPLKHYPSEKLAVQTSF